MACFCNSSCYARSIGSILFTRVRGKKRNSRKFAVASDPSGAAPSTPRRHGGTPQASKRGDLVLFVAPLCSKELRLVTVQLPEKSWLSDRGSTRLWPSSWYSKNVVKDVVLW